MHLVCPSLHATISQFESSHLACHANPQMSHFLLLWIIPVRHAKYNYREEMDPHYMGLGPPRRVLNLLQNIEIIRKEKPCSFQSWIYLVLLSFNYHREIHFCDTQRNDSLWHTRNHGHVWKLWWRIRRMRWSQKASHSPEEETVRPRQLDVLLICTQLVSNWVNCEHISPNSESSIFSPMMPTLLSSYHPNEEH